MLTSAKNPKVAAVLRLTKRAFREEDRRFLVEGAQAVGEALDVPGSLETLFVVDALAEVAVRARQADVPVIEVSAELMRRLADTVTPQGVVGVAPFRDVPLETLEGAAGCVAVLHEVRDPGNAGTILRTADAVGASGVVFTAASVDPYNSKAVRSSAGSLFHLPMVRGAPLVDVVDRLRAGRARVLAMDARGGSPLDVVDLAGPVAFVVGNEAHGLSPEDRALADEVVRVPQPGRAESMNVATAASICLYEWSRRGRAGERALHAIIAAAAHDIRSPLTAMKGFGYALEKRWDVMTPEQRAVMLQGIVHDADRMDTILRQLVDAARVQSGTLEAYREQVEVADLVLALAELQRRDPEHPEVVWEGRAATVFADPIRLRTTLLAFCESLVWWAHEGPIRVGADRTGDMLHVWAGRSGSDLDASSAEALFTPRAPGSGGGSKIGLYVARGVAEASGGRAWAEAPDGELRFHVEIDVSVPDFPHA